MQPVALVLGESLVDAVVDGGAHPGGSAANVAVALARLGRPVRFGTSFADDADGRLVREHLVGAGVELASDPGIVDRTSRAVARLRDDGSADYAFDLDWRLGPVSLRAGERPVVVHVGSYGAVLSPGEAAVRREVLRWRESATVSYDVNARPSVTGVGADVVRRVEVLAGLADVVKASDEDLEVFWPDRSLDEAAAHLLGLGAAAVVVTRGAEGARWFVGDTWGDVAPLPVEVADTIGAGDTFAAAVVDGLWERDLLGGDRRDQLRGGGAEVWSGVLAWAARVAAVTVSRPGADPPRRDEV